MAKYPYIVNLNGVWYPAETEVPEGANSIKEKKDDDFFKYMNPLEKRERVEYTKTEINRMPTAKLKEFATINGISNAGDITSAELKKILIEKFEL